MIDVLFEQGEAKPLSCPSNVLQVLPCPNPKKITVDTIFSVEEKDPEEDMLGGQSS
jgi:hypothetical protein